MDVVSLDKCDDEAGPIVELCVELDEDAPILVIGGGKSIKEECRQLLTISSPSIELNCSTFCNGGGKMLDEGVDAGRVSILPLLLLLLLLILLTLLLLLLLLMLWLLLLLLLLSLLLIFLSCCIGVRIS